MKMNANKIKKSLLSIVLFSVILFSSCSESNDFGNYTYWKSKDNSILVESKDSFYLFFPGFKDGINLKKMTNSNSGYATLSSGNFEYCLYFNLPLSNMNKANIINYDYLNSDSIEMRVKGQDSLFYFNKLNHLISWDSLVLENYIQDNLFVKKTIYPQNDHVINAFCTFLFMGFADSYSPSTSIDYRFKLFLYLKNGKIVAGETTTIPNDVARILFKDTKKNKMKSPIL